MEGNEIADLYAREAAESGKRYTGKAKKRIAQRISLAHLGRRRTEKAKKSWKTEIETRRGREGRGRRGAFQMPRDRPRIREGLRRVSKGLAARFYQLYSGHAMIAPFLKDR